MGSIIPGPTPAYSNPPIEPQFYQPRQFFISTISLGSTTTVTTTTNHDYAVANLVRLLIPPANGCRQLNEVTGYVVSVPAANQIVLDIYSSGGDAFVSTSGGTQPQTVAVGDISMGQINSSGRVNNLTYIPGSFINISPQ